MQLHPFCRLSNSKEQWHLLIILSSYFEVGGRNYPSSLLIGNYYVNPGSLPRFKALQSSVEFLSLYDCRNRNHLGGTSSRYLKGRCTTEEMSSLIFPMYFKIDLSGCIIVPPTIQLKGSIVRQLSMWVVGSSAYVRCTVF